MAYGRTGHLDPSSAALRPQQAIVEDGLRRMNKPAGKLRTHPQSLVCGALGHELGPNGVRQGECEECGLCAFSKRYKTGIYPLITLTFQ
jgi:hypothetical protein